jgi:outer membrane protein TolC
MHCFATLLLGVLPSLAQDVPDLPALLRALEDGHPRLRAGAARVSAAEARVAPMQALPDPEVRLAYTNDGVDTLTLGDSPDGALTVSYEQEMPARGKRRLGGEVATAEVEVARAELEIDRRLLREEVIVAYLEVLRADRTRAVVEASREILQTLLASARARYEAGGPGRAGGPPEDADRAHAHPEIETADLEQDRAQAQARLNAALARPAGPCGPSSTPCPRSRCPAGRRRSAPSRPRPRWSACAGWRPSPPRAWSGRAWGRRPTGCGASPGRSGAGSTPWSRGWWGRGFRSGGRASSGRRRRRPRETCWPRRPHAGRAWTPRREVEGSAGARRRGRGRRREVLEQALIPQARSTLEAGSASYANGRTVFIAVLDDALDLLEFERDLERQRTELGTALARIELRTGLRLVAPEETP